MTQSAQDKALDFLRSIPDEWVMRDALPPQVNAVVDILIEQKLLRFYDPNRPGLAVGVTKAVRRAVMSKPTPRPRLSVAA